MRGKEQQPHRDVVIVSESMFGNTELVASAVAKGLVAAEAWGRHLAGRPPPV